MADKRLTLMLMLLVLATLLWPQNEARTQDEMRTQFYLDMDSEEPRFVQRLSWVGDEHVLRYEVIIEKEDEGEVLRKFTETSFIEVSLPPGVYQYDVVPYDVLNRPSSRLGWRPLIIFTAWQPELDNFSPRFFYLEKDQTWVLTVSGKNLVSESEIYLRCLDSDIPPVIPFEAVILNNGSGARLSFDSNQFVLGSYELHIKDPGGLETNLAGLAVIPPKPPKPARKAALFLGIAWMPVIPFYGMEDLPGDRMEQSIYPYGMSVRLSCVFPGESPFNLGMELAASGYLFGLSSPGDPNMATIDCNLLAQAWARDKKAAVLFRFGLGPAVLSSTEARFQLNMGSSFVFVIRRLYLETGFTLYFLPADSPASYLSPWIGAGVKF